MFKVVTDIATEQVTVMVMVMEVTVTVMEVTDIVMDPHKGNHLQKKEQSSDKSSTLSK